jgi:hypothetical protein
VAKLGEGSAFSPNLKPEKGPCLTSTISPSEERGIFFYLIVMSADHSGFLVRTIGEMVCVFSRKYLAAIAALIVLFPARIPAEWFISF